MFELDVLSRLMYALLDLPFRIAFALDDVFCFLTNKHFSSTHSRLPLFFTYISLYIMDNKEAIAMESCCCCCYELKLCLI